MHDPAHPSPDSQPFVDELVALLPRARAFALSLTRSASDADDLVQAACERALKARDQWEPGTRLDAWLFRIARNLWIDGIRKRKREGEREDLDDHHDIVGSDGRADGETALAIGELERALAEMSGDQRDLLTGICGEGMSYREAAEHFSIPIGTVMSRLARARRDLAARLGIAMAPMRRPKGSGQGSGKASGQGSGQGSGKAGGRADHGAAEAQGDRA